VKQSFVINLTHPSRSAVVAAAIVAGAALAWQPQRADAVILGFTQGNTTPPPDDPGFYNVSSDGSSFVYLGDSWVLTARHTGVANPTFGGETYRVIPNTAVTLQNPAGMNLTSETDLRMFRIDGNPDLPSLRISASTPPVGAQVTMIGRGRQRDNAQVQWNVQKNGDTWTWTETSGLGDYRGFRVPGNAPRDTRWGTNRIEDDFKVTGESDPGHTSVVEVRDRDVISLLTIWDESGGTPHEAQAVAGDSGGGVFYKRGGQWELAGIMNAVLMFPNQEDELRSFAIYGQATSFADLSSYRSEILSITADPSYSIMGDINLDGKVSGDGSGSASVDDLSAFVSGWLTTHPSANIDSWKLGDLNQDAVTDLHDFRMLRNAHPAAAALAPALGMAHAIAIPEPATWLLLVIAGLVGCGVFRRGLRQPEVAS
jgi:hypothetical protein